jgi:hypothetical protein
MTLAVPAASQVVPGILGFLVVAGMGLALFFLLRSMNKQLRKVAPGPKWRSPGGASPPDEPAAPGPAAPAQDDQFQQNGTRLS